MITGTIYRQTDKKPLVTNAWKTESAWERMRGLLGRKQLSEQDALLIAPCSSVHTIGMKYPIDIIYLDMKGKVLKTVSELKPLRFSLCFNASYTLELAPGFLRCTPVKKGEMLEWRNQS